jgi:hypothetical protein
MLNSLIGIIASSGAGGVANSYESIATVTVGSAVSSVTFTGIPSTYQHLQVRAMHTMSLNGQGINMQVGNGSIDTGSNYYYHYLQGNGATAIAGAAGGLQAAWILYYTTGNASTSTPMVEVWDFLDYANTNKYKTSRLLAGTDGNGSGELFLGSGLWQNTAAINTIKINTSSGNFNQYSSFALYGIKG